MCLLGDESGGEFSGLGALLLLLRFQGKRLAGFVCKLLIQREAAFTEDREAEALFERVKRTSKLDSRNRAYDAVTANCKVLAARTGKDTRFRTGTFVIADIKKIS